MSFEARIVVLGAGVIGLTTALQLVRKGYKHIAIVAKHMPSDHHLDYCSSWAGVNWIPVSKEGSEEAQWDLETWKELNRLARDVPAAGVWISDKTVYGREQSKLPELEEMWYKDVVYDFRMLEKHQVPADIADWGIFFRTIGLDPSIYLHYLQAQCLDAGVAFHRLTIGHIREAFTAENSSGGRTSPPVRLADVVVNCTGLWASKLGGVMDSLVRPMRGQLVIVENESHGQFRLSRTDDMQAYPGESCYIKSRPAGGGTVLGGCFDPSSSWNQEPDMALAQRIMERAVKLCPQLVPAGCGAEALRVVRHQVGLRPFREGGPRIERETIEDDHLGSLRVVHCYGSGSFGFQASYGMANKAVRLVEETLEAEFPSRH